MSLNEGVCLREKGRWGWSLMCLWSHNLEDAWETWTVLPLVVKADSCSWGQGTCLNHLGDPSRFCICSGVGPCVGSRESLNWGFSSEPEGTWPNQGWVAAWNQEWADNLLCVVHSFTQVCGQDVNYVVWEEENGDKNSSALEIFNCWLSESLSF